MTVQEYVADVATTAETVGWGPAAQRAVDDAVCGLHRRLDRLPVRRRTNIFDREWDICIVLDGCRADLMDEVARDDVLPEREVIRSVGTGSPQWMRHTFAREKARSTAYVTANPFSHWFVDADDVARFDPVYADCWSDEDGTVLPQPVTDRAIATWRRCNPSRMVVHYMQPHYPFVPDTLGDTYDGIGTIPDRPVWGRLKDGEFSHERVWRAYRANLEYALASVGLLLRAVDADVVITSDHGNAMGERGIYGHANGLPIPPLVEVPWIETTAERVRPYDPDEDHLQPGFEDATPGVSVAETGVQNRLEALGYR